MEGELVGRRMVITGGTGALGIAVVEALLEAGAACHVTWNDPAQRDRFPHTEKVTLHRLDCCDEAQVADFYGGFADLWGAAHLVGGFAMGPIEKMDAQQVRQMFELNALTAALCCREAVKAMRRGTAAASAAAAATSGGRIVNVSARPAVRPAAGLCAYAMGKAAVAALTQGLAEEVGDDGILVNAVLPSIMDTPANRRAMPDADFDTWPKVAEVARTIRFLLSPSNTLTSGALVPVYGRA